MTLSAIILSRDGQVDKRILDSVKFADEVIIWDSLQHHLTNFANQRNQALKKAKSNWVLFVDDDEYVSTELANEILEAINSQQFSGYFLPRLDIVFHNLQKYGEIGQIKIIRLAKKTAGKFIRPVHETWQLKGVIGRLENPLYHLKDDFVSGFIGRINDYCLLDAQTLSREGKPFSFFRLLFYPKAKFLRNYFWLRGFLDGYSGLFHAYLMAVQSLSVRIFQWSQPR